jgi:hypothetical protein
MYGVGQPNWERPALTSLSPKAFAKLYLLIARGDKNAFEEAFKGVTSALSQDQLQAQPLKPPADAESPRQHGESNGDTNAQLE